MDQILVSKQNLSNNFGCKTVKKDFFNVPLKCHRFTKLFMITVSSMIDLDPVAAVTLKNFLTLEFYCLDQPVLESQPWPTSWLEVKRCLPSVTTLIQKHFPFHLWQQIFFPPASASQSLTHQEQRTQKVKKVIFLIMKNIFNDAYGTQRKRKL